MQSALRYGAGGLLLDVQASSDGRAVVFRDAALDCRTNGSGRVAERDARLSEAARHRLWLYRRRRPHLPAARPRRRRHADGRGGAARLRPRAAGLRPRRRARRRGAGRRLRPGGRRRSAPATASPARPRRWRGCGSSTPNGWVLDRARERGLPRRLSPQRLARHRPGRLPRHALSTSPMTAPGRSGAGPTASSTGWPASARACS